jgi:hypothetical protein
MQHLSLSAIPCPTGPAPCWESSPLDDLIITNPYWQSA